MTRVRIFEWLIAAFLIVIAHGVAVSAWLLYAPSGSSGVVLPQAPVAQTDKSAARSVALSVKITGLEPQAPLVAANPAQGSETAAGISTSPAATDKDTSQVPKSDTDDVVTTVVSAAPIKQIDDNAGPQPAGQNEVIATTEPEIVKLANSDAETEDAESTATRAAIRDPVPVPKVKPANATLTDQIAPPAEEADNNSANGDTKVAAVSPATPETNAESQASSAAQTNYYRLLIAKLKDKRVYPTVARREGKVGTVYMQIVVKSDGAISSYEILRSSGHAVLDEAAVEALRDASPLSEFPKDITDKELKFGVPLRFP